MAISLTGEFGPFYGNGSSISTSLPSGASVGDLLVLVVDNQTTADTFSTPTGWNKAYHAADDGISTGRGNKIVLWRVMQSGDTGPTVSQSGTGDMMYHAMSFDGVDTTDPFGADSGWSSAGFNGSGNTIQVGSVTTTVDGAWALALFGSNYASYNTTPTGYTLIGHDYLQGHYRKEIATAGSSGTATSGTSDDNAGYIAIQVELKPASTGVTGTGTADLPFPTADATGTLEYVGSSTSDLPFPTVDATGTLEYVGTATGALPFPTVDATGELEYVGSVTADLPFPTADATGDYTPEGGTIIADLPFPTASASGFLSYVATATVSLPFPTADGDGWVEAVGSATADLPFPTADATGSLGYVGTATANLPFPTVTALGDDDVEGSITVDLPFPAVAVSGGYLSSSTGSMTVTLPFPSVDDTGGSYEIPVTYGRASRPPLRFRMRS